MRHLMLLLSASLAAPALAADPAAVADTYADIAEATYGDSLTTAQTLQVAVNALVAAPSADTMTARLDH